VVESMWCRGVGATALPLVFLLGCAGALTTPPTPPPEPLGSAASRDAALLLAMEEERVFDGPEMERLAAAPEAEIRMRAALAAGRIGAPEGATLVRALLLDPHPEVAAGAAFAAGLLRDEEAVGTLSEMLDRPVDRAGARVAAVAAGALGELETPAAREALAAFLRRADPADPALQAVARAALIAAAGAAVADPDLFGRWLTSSEPETRLRAVQALALGPHAGAILRLLPGVGDADPRVRGAALRALDFHRVGAAEISPERVLPSIVAALGDTASAVRAEAVRALATYPDVRALEALSAMAISGEGHPRLAAIEGLGRLGTAAARSAGVLRSIAERADAPPAVRRAAVEAVARIDPVDSSGWLRGVADDPDPAVRIGAARSLGRSGPRELVSIVGLARDADPDVSAAALSSAGSEWDVESLPLLRSLLLERLGAAEVQVRAAALQGLARLADSATFPALLDAYDRAGSDPDNLAALAAIDALTALRASGAVATERAFFARFPRPDDRATEHRALSGLAAARAVWGGTRPLSTPRDSTEYRVIVERWIAPIPADRRLPSLVIHTEAGEVELLVLVDASPLAAADLLALVHPGSLRGSEWPLPPFEAANRVGVLSGDTGEGPGYRLQILPCPLAFFPGGATATQAGEIVGVAGSPIRQAPESGLVCAGSAVARIVRGADVLDGIRAGDTTLTTPEILVR